MTDKAFQVYEEYAFGQIATGDVGSLVAVFRSPPPSEWCTKYHAKIERKEDDLYDVIITDKDKTDAFIEEELPAFKEDIAIAEEKNIPVLVLKRDILFENESQKQARLAVFRSLHIKQ